VDKTNQQLSYYLTKSRSRRKQNHILLSIIEIYALCNMHTVWRNIENFPFEQRKMLNADFGFLIINHYYSNFRMLNSGSEPAQPERCTTREVLLSPRRGHHDQVRMSAVDAPNDEKRIRCWQCRSKTGYKCTKCSSLTCVMLCQHKSGGKQCWNEWHTKR